MHDRWKQLTELAKGTKVSASRAAASARVSAGKASDAALAASKIAAGTISDKAEDVSRRLKPQLEEATVEASRRTKELSAAVAAQAKVLKDRVFESASKLDRNHEKVATHVETVSMAAGIAAGIAASAAWIAAPTGLAAIAVLVGVRNAPGVVGIAGVLAVISMIAGFVSGVADFYSMWKRKRARSAHGPIRQ